MKPIDRVFKAMCQADLARALCIKPGVIAQWKVRGIIPAKWCLRVEELTGVSRYDLRPDIYGRRPK
jgi:DNA-binding transcriptional regulator YdaS (Cro superfamily)